MRRTKDVYKRQVLVSAREFGGSDTYATSQILAAAIKKIGLEDDDVVFCGRQAIDGDTAQVGPQIAEKLGIPQVSYAADIQKEGETLTIKRMLEDGYMTIKVNTPCLITLSLIHISLTPPLRSRSSRLSVRSPAWAWLRPRAWSRALPRP